MNYDTLVLGADEKTVDTSNLKNNITHKEVVLLNIFIVNLTPKQSQVTYKIISLECFCSHCFESKKTTQILYFSV